MTEAYAVRESTVASLGVDARAAFIARTYGHLLAAVVGFVAVEVMLFTSGLAERIFSELTGVSWLWVIGAFLIVGWFASRAARRAASPWTQYTALAGFVLAQALILVPLLYYAQTLAEGVIESAALVTLIGFGSLTAIAFATRKDFSFLGGFVRWGMLLILILIVAGILFGFRLGTYFSVAVIGVAGAAILHDTSNVLRRFPPDCHVAAALELFSSVAVLFWGVLRLFTSLSRQ